MRGFLIVLVLFFGVAVEAQNDYKLRVKKTNIAIDVDGNHETWATNYTDVAKGFWKSYPNDGVKAESTTTVYLTYDDENLYILAICYDDLEGDHVVQSLKRDYSFPVNDAFAVFIDPFKDRTNGFSFSVGPMGNQRDGILQAGGQFGVTTSWDGKFKSAVKRYDGYWVAEMAIPFKTIRFDKSQKSWYINFARNDLKRNEVSTWYPVPTGFNVANMAYSGELVWDEPPTKKGANINLIPSVLSGFEKDYLNDESKFNWNIGLDAKVALSSSLNLDLTVYPDFSQVEVDDQVINLSRFSIRFPEKRTFFLENSDMFNLGMNKVRPFFSRKIGLNNGAPVPIIAGARLSGNIDENWRIGAMTIQTEGVGESDLNPQNYSVFALQRRLWSRSSIKAFYINRQAFENFDYLKDDYNRVGGIEFKYKTDDNKYGASVLVHAATNQNKGKDFSFFGADFTYQTRNWYVYNMVQRAGADYITDIGFVPRLYHRDAESGNTFTHAYNRYVHVWKHIFYPKTERLNNWGIEFIGGIYLNKDFSFRDYDPSPAVFFTFKNNGALKAKYTHNIETLLYDGFVVDTVVAKGRYSFPLMQLSFQSAKQKKFYYNIASSIGKWFVANRYSLDGGLTYRAQPWGNFSFTASINQFNFPEEWERTTRYLLFGPKVELSFTDDIFLSTFVQYNTQSDNFNINTRFQWQFAPLSNLYIVYTDNYYSLAGEGDTFSNFGQKNRALVVKLNYWFTL